MKRIKVSEVPEVLLPLIEKAVKGGAVVCLSTERFAGNVQQIFIFDGQYRIYLTDVGPERRSGEYRFSPEQAKELELVF